jgi:3-phytase
MSPHCHQLRLTITRSQNFLKPLLINLAAVGVTILPLAKAAAQNIPSLITVTPKVSTTAVKGDADDPAIWIHPNTPAKSVVIGTDKETEGGLYVWDMNGKQIQYVPLGRPNNVDLRYGMKVGGQLIDIAVTNSRSNPKQIKVYKINSDDGTLTDITTASGILTPELADPYGLCLYQRKSDGAMFVIESTQEGATKNLHQYRLEDDGAGKVKGTYVRAFGNNTIKQYVEGLVADDELGYVYASDETNAVRKYYADRDLNKDDQIVAFATGDGISGDREGLAIYKCADKTGYLLLSNQSGTNVKVYRREGEGGDPHQHTLLTTIKTNGSSSTDGLDVTNRPTSSQFSKGFLVTHNSPGSQFKLYAWEDIAQTYLSICPGATTGVSDGNAGALPVEFSLEQNFPNPFLSGAKSLAQIGGNSATAIPFHLEKAAPVKLTVINLMGQTVRTLAERQMEAGEHSLSWDGRNDAGSIVPAGTYLLRLDTGNQTQIKKLMMVK